jgi:hypothetical protein
VVEGEFSYRCSGGVVVVRGLVSYEVVMGCDELRGVMRDGFVRVPPQAYIDDQRVIPLQVGITL